MNGLSFEIKWASSLGGSPVDVTRGSLVVRLGENVVWGRTTDQGTVGFEWTWVDFLEHVARVWSSLLWQPYPLGVSPASPIDFPPLARTRLADLAGAVREQHETDVWSFVDAHDLAHGVAGARLPSLWLMPEGRLVTVGTNERSVRVSLDESVGELERFCAQIATRLEAVDHPRAVGAVANWAKRHDSSADLLPLSTGLSEDEIEAISTKGESPSVTFDVATHFAMNEFVATARATRGIVPAADLRMIFSVVRKVSARHLPKLAAASAAIKPVALVGPDYEQGNALASALRAYFGNPDKALDPKGLLTSWGIRIRERYFAPQVNAVAVWGAKHGPLIVLNVVGRFNKGHGRNTTLAHEICHLLVDREGALPLGEALGGLAPSDIEARANAFAAELLAPQQVVLEMFLNASGPEAALRAASRYFKASAEVIAWQRRNAVVPLSADEREYLRTQVSRPYAF